LTPPPKAYRIKINNNMSKFDKLTEAYMNVVKESSYNLYTDVLNPLNSILAVDESVGETLDNVDDLVQFLIQKNPSIQNDLLEYVKSKGI
jgi:hypothetical protein